MNRTPRAILRTAGRVVLLDAAGDVLLVCEREGEYARWLTPGGGLEPDETPAQAAVRELHEETGITVAIATDQPAWHLERSVWTIEGDRYDQTNHYFLVRVAQRAPAVAPASLTDYEQQVMIGFRWWSIGELSTTTDTVWPHDLATLLAAETAD